MSTTLHFRSRQNRGINRVNVREARSDYEVAQLSECYQFERETAKNYIKALSNAEEVKGMHEGGYDDIFIGRKDRGMLGMDYVKQLCRHALSIVPSYGMIDFKSNNNLIAARAVVVSNLSNQLSMTPTTYNNDIEARISFWYEPIGRSLPTITTNVRMVVKNDEFFKYNPEAEQVVCNKNANASILAQALTLSKSEIELFDEAGREKILNKLVGSKGGMSRMTRLVIACMYHIAIDLSGENKTINIRPRDHDVFKMMNGDGYHTMSLSDDMAYVHCMNADDAGYLSFLYIISREFPYCYDLLTIKNGDGDVTAYSKYCGISIPEEAKSIAIGCNVPPADIRGKDINYNSGLWYSYLINYARSIGQESKLDEAYATACMMMEHDVLVNVSLPLRRSTAEMFQLQHVVKMTECSVPLLNVVKTALLGGVLSSAAVVTLYKEIQSHNDVMMDRGANSNSIYFNMLRNEESRLRWSLALEDGGLGSIATLARNMDLFRMANEGDKEKLLKLLNPLPYYIISPYEHDKILPGGFIKLIKKCEHKNRRHIVSIQAENRGEIMAHKRMLCQAHGPIDRARLIQDVLNFDDNMCDIAETWLQDGHVSIVKGGINILSGVTQHMTPIKYVKMNRVVEVDTKKHTRKQEINDELARRLALLQPQSSYYNTCHGATTTGVLDVGGRHGHSVVDESRSIKSVGAGQHGNVIGRLGVIGDRVLTANAAGQEEHDGGDATDRGVVGRAIDDVMDELKNVMLNRDTLVKLVQTDMHESSREKLGVVSGDSASIMPTRINTALCASETTTRHVDTIGQDILSWDDHGDIDDAITEIPKPSDVVKDKRITDEIVSGGTGAREHNNDNLRAEQEAMCKDDHINMLRGRIKKAMRRSETGSLNPIDGRCWDAGISEAIKINSEGHLCTSYVKTGDMGIVLPKQITGLIGREYVELLDEQLDKITTAGSLLVRDVAKILGIPHGALVCWLECRSLRRVTFGLSNSVVGVGVDYWRIVRGGPTHKKVVAFIQKLCPILTCDIDADLEIDDVIGQFMIGLTSDVGRSPEKRKERAEIKDAMNKILKVLDPNKR